MRQTDVLIIGGGLAGSTAAAMLGRAGVATVMVDPHEVYPPDFRCEKLDVSQQELLRKTGLADAVLPATTGSSIWAYRPGGLIDRKPIRQFNASYETFVNAMRAAIGGSATVIHAKANTISAGPDRQSATLSSGETISARLVVLANGLNAAVRRNLGMDRKILSTNHSVSIGFDIRPVGRARFDFPAMTFHSRRPAERYAYLALFPIGAAMRANLFVYRDMNDPWLPRMRQEPVATLVELIPALRRVAGAFDVPEFVKIRPVDLYATTGYRQPGIVLVGDAFGTSCPAAGTGANKVLTDVERLCNHHIAGWLATPGMGTEKTAAFYEDPVKLASDADSLARAFRVRAMAIDSGLLWAARRTVKMAGRIALGVAGSARGRLAASPPDGEAAANSAGRA